MAELSEQVVADGSRNGEM